MDKKYILYLTTNSTWGGSEVLWALSAEKFIKEDFLVKAAAWYSYKSIKKLFTKKEFFFDLGQSNATPGFALKVLRKIKKNSRHNILLDLTKKRKPDLVIISQGNNKDGLGLMQFCDDHKLPFVTIIHLVSENLWPGLNDERIDQLNVLFHKATMNFFVSRHTMMMHEKILGQQFSNKKIIYNPFTKLADESIKYPSIVDGQYKVALVGRLENFHKGYDLLIDVVKHEKWKTRNIHFSIFGKGPHAALLKRSISMHNIKNISVNEYVENISEIWKEHHILMMPSRMEGQSLTLIEAMRFKRAAIVTNVGGVEELIEDGNSGFIAEYPTEKHIDIAMERAWAARDDWEKMGAEAYHQIKKNHPADAVSYFNKQLENLLT